MRNSSGIIGVCSQVIHKVNIMAKTKGQYIIDDKGKKTAVILPIGEYEELLEGLHDLAVIAERKNELEVSFNDIKKRLRKDGLLETSRT